MQHRSGTARFGFVKRMLVPMIVGAALAVLAPAPTWAQTPSADALTQMEAQIFVLVNQARAQAGFAPLTRAPELDTAARRHSQDMATTGNFSHLGSDASTFWQRAEAAGYTGFANGENISAGLETAEGTMNGWMNSIGHRDNILNPNSNEIGIAVVFRASSPYRYYWTQVFGAR
jgi:uncharacterized protein YkwD